MYYLKIQDMLSSFTDGESFQNFRILSKFKVYFLSISLKFESLMYFVCCQTTRASSLEK